MSAGSLSAQAASVSRELPLDVQVDSFTLLVNAEGLPADKHSVNAEGLPAERAIKFEAFTLLVIAKTLGSSVACKRQAGRAAAGRSPQDC